MTEEKIKWNTKVIEYNEKLNWIIRNTRKLEFHTNMDVLLEPIKDDIQKFKWLISDLEINTSEMQHLPVYHEKDWFLISATEMEKLRNSYAQIIWGAFSVLDKELEIEITNDILTKRLN